MNSYITKTITYAAVSGAFLTIFVTGPLGAAIVVTPKFVACIAAEVIVLSAYTASIPL